MSYPPKLNDKINVRDTKRKKYNMQIENVRYE